MTETRTKQLTIFSPAKINLYLHVTGRLNNGYHTLDSLIAFADIGDTVKIEPASSFKFVVKGPFARSFSSNELDSSAQSENIAVHAVWELARAAQKSPDILLTLTKNLPLASGLGGGSSNAASVIWGLQEWWSLPRDAKYLATLLASLGADVPVCLFCRPSRIRSVGEIIDPIEDSPEMPIVLVNPMKSCSTASVFADYSGQFKEPQNLPKDFSEEIEYIEFLKKQENDLYSAARIHVPDIDNVLHALSSLEGCLIHRLSGSGATCFGLFDSEENALKAKETIMSENPDWWVASGWINRPERY